MEIKIKKSMFDDGYRSEHEEIIRDITLFLDDFKKKSNRDFYRFLCHFYDVKIDDNDYMDYVNFKTNANYNRVIRIDTDVIHKDIEREGHGRDFSWWTVTYRLYLKVLINDELEDNEKKWTIDEIKILINEGKIYPIDYFFERCDDRLYASNVKNDINYLVKNVGYGEIDDSCEYFDYFMENIENNVVFSAIYEEIRKYILGRKMYLECRLRDYIYSDEDWVYDELNIINKLIDSYNKRIKFLKENKDDKKNDDLDCMREILMDPLEIVVDYLFRLPSIDKEYWYDEIEYEQIILILETIDYDENKELCEKIVDLIISLDDLEFCLSIASSCSWVDFYRMMDIIIASGNDLVNYEVLTDMLQQINSEYVKKHLQVVIDGGSPELNYKLALNDDFKEYIKGLGLAVISSKDAEYNYLFALNVENADVKSHGEVVVDSGDLYYNNLFALYVPGADILKHYDVLVRMDNANEYKSSLKRILKK